MSENPIAATYDVTMTIPAAKRNFVENLAVENLAVENLAAESVNVGSYRSSAFLLMIL